MITLTAEAAQQIEEALGNSYYHLNDEFHRKHLKALAAIRAARAQEQAEQEPLLWGDDKFSPHERPVKQEHREPTHDEYLELAKNAVIVAAHEHCHLNEQEMTKAWVVEYGSQVYAKAWLDGFESAQQEEQEPCGHVLPDGTICWDRWCPDAGTLLYTHPVRTKDLTDDEIEDLYFERFSMSTLREFARAVITADRSKNK